MRSGPLNLPPGDGYMVCSRNAMYARGGSGTNGQRAHHRGAASARDNAKADGHSFGSRANAQSAPSDNGSARCELARCLPLTGPDRSNPHGGRRPLTA